MLISYQWRVDGHIEWFLDKRLLPVIRTRPRHRCLFWRNILIESSGSRCERWTWRWLIRGNWANRSVSTRSWVEQPPTYKENINNSMYRIFIPANSFNVERDALDTNAPFLLNDGLTKSRLISWDPGAGFASASCEHNMMILKAICVPGFTMGRRFDLDAKAAVRCFLCHSATGLAEGNVSCS